MEQLRHTDDVYSSRFMSSLKAMREQQLFTDFQLTVDKVSLPCHRLVLAAASPYFATMFTCGFSESETLSADFKSFRLDTIKVLLDYMYTASVDISSENVQDLVHACDQFQLDELKKACEQFMQTHVDPCNCIGFFRFAKLFRLRQLMASAQQCMLQNFRNVLKESQEFLKLTEDELIEYVSSEDLCVPNEDLVVEAVLMWIKCEPIRQESLNRILKHVRFSFCTTTYLCHVAMKQPLLAITPEAREMIRVAAAYHLLPDQQPSLPVAPRRSMKTDTKLVVVGGLLKNEQENKYCWYFNTDTTSWDLLAQLPRQNCKFYCAVATRDGILITGGYHGNVKKECWFFDATDKKWKLMPAMTTARCKHKSVLQGSDVVVIGGEDDSDQLLTSVEKFDTKKRQWRNLTPMKKALSEPLVVSFENSLFVMSGIQDDDTSSCCTQKFDPTWNEWEFMSEMPEPCRLGAAATLSSAIYVIGGFTRTCLRYEPTTDCWTSLSRPSGKHGNAPAVVWSGRILVGGGDVIHSETTSSIEEYNPETDSWALWKIPLKEDLSCHYMLNLFLTGL